MLEQKIYNDYVQALKQRDREKTTFLSFIRAALKNQAIDLRKDKLSDEETLAVLAKERKRLRDAHETIANSQRQDALDEIKRQLALLEAYLPQELDSEKLAAIINEAIAEENASSIKEMGKVMKHVLAKVGTQADAKKVSELVKQRLSAL